MGQIGETEGWASAALTPSGGQQSRCEGEGSGLWAGEAPAGTPTAAREFMPVHAKSGWLTDTAQPRSATIKTTPRDRLAITGKIVGEEGKRGCDRRHAQL